ncbi:hypothetical protein COJ92_22440 [Priestia megaterium]|uniref:hypothetical protein n=1 Tax=Priestia megaterium TaxID=1404 RepID=UPI000BF7C353|nr:hypothetical protein [Priestia megaterium]PFP15261.1 hypothetical protein COJ92_22440 [Priestia megaterium]
MYLQTKVKNQKQAFVVGVEYYEEDLFLEIELGSFYTTQLHAQRIANSVHNVILLENQIVIIFKNADSITLTDDFLKYAFKFRLCTKPTIPPLDISKLTQQEKDDLVFNEAYMVTEEDMEEVQWDINTAFRYLQHQYEARDKTFFSLSSSAYYVIPTSEEIDQEGMRNAT